MVPIAPSMTRMRSASRRCSVSARCGSVQGRAAVMSVLLRGVPRGGLVGVPAPGSGFGGLVGDERDDFEMRRTALAGDGLTTGHVQSGPARELLQVLLGESEVDVSVRLDDAAVLVARQAGQQQASAGA